ncbi:isoleucine--tRNA ligase [Candidatus Parcubacteria bacterium]|nr:MAG: isoleucine--tRNA ligase [Candidatus Parcubacteria bacterium]
MSAEIGKSEVAKREEEILAFWNERKIFEKTLEKEAPNGDYVFYDGPPFATGLPHYGHIVASVIKDVVPRYFTMRGYHVPRRWGWDCHGLPIENIVEKELGFKHKKDILEMGVAAFNERCRERVLTYASEWEKIIPRIGRWADMKNAYRTMDKPFMESVWWVFKQLYDKGLVYEDYRSMHICPRCETTLSQQEVSEGYKDVKDIAVTVKFKVKNPEKIGLSGDVYLLAWTTTPWTLPGNVALAVGKDIKYVTVKRSLVQKFREGEDITSAINGRYILATNRLKDVMREAEFEGEQEILGSKLVGLEYEPLFDYYINDKNLKNRENGWKVYAADFVTTDTGTGIAHEAPAFGADDWELLKKVNLPFVQHVNGDGTMRPEVKDFAGMEVKPRSDDDKVRLGTDIAVLKYLQEHNLLFSKESITHSYPHCWRCDTPLLNYATSSWFVKIEAQKDEIIRNARPINWSPEHIKEGRWGKWLEGARDWSISRQRFWASVIPLWRCQKCKTARVFGSARELEEASGKKVDDLHKHIVDDIVFSCWQCDGEMHRIPDVLDTWFDSGSMPYGERHYPFENKEKFENVFPAQFIAEGLDQTRAWFYYMHILAVSIFGRNAFQNVIVNGIVLAEDGKKMSKKLKNYPDPMEVVEKYGADALRFYLLASPVVAAENLSFSEKGVDEIVKKNIGRLGNVLAFYQLYADGTARDWKSGNILDRWILLRLDELIREVTKGFNSYQLDAASRPITGFIDDLSVWYVRRSRDRFKAKGEDKKAALATLRYVLHDLSRVMAPITPFFAEHIFQAVRESEDEESVHLAAWPEARATANFLQRLLGQGKEGEELLSTMSFARGVVTNALMQRSEAGIKVRQPLTKLTIKLSGSEPFFWKDIAPLIADEVNVKEVVLGNDSVLDTEITTELKEEGMVRDFIRSVQEARKEAKLTPRDKVRIHYGEVADEAVLLEHKTEILDATNAVELLKKSGEGVIVEKVD